MARRRAVRLITMSALMIGMSVAMVSVVLTARSEGNINPKLTPVTLQRALQAYRSHPAPLWASIPGPSGPVQPAKGLAGFRPPAPGVYAYRTEGSDWAELGTRRYVRTWPTTTYATVRRSGGCVWELAFQVADEYLDGHRQCSAPHEFLCLAHLQKVEFSGVTHQMTHRCTPPMVQVGAGVAKAGGHASTKCYAAGDASTIEMRYLGRQKVTVAGQERYAHHVVLDSSVQGIVNGTAVADVWFDTQTGMYLKMIRRQDTTTTAPDGSIATYRVRATYVLMSLTPQV